MNTTIRDVLVCEAVDNDCVELLTKVNINVAYKLKLSEHEPCKEVAYYDAVVGPQNNRKSPAIGSWTS